MFCSNLRFVPWKNREEWLKVYNDAYSEDRDRQTRACQTMEIWLVMRNDVPPGVECTLNIISALLQEDRQSSRQLQMIFSTAVLRVVNMLCDNSRQSSKDTIYSIAKYYNLPDWIVNLRHDVSHGTSLPDLSALKRAAKFLLVWLQEYYWEVEKEEMRDIVLKRSRYDACKDNVDFYIRIYIELAGILHERGDIKLKQIKNDDLMLRALDINSRRGLKCAIECMPWIMHSRDIFSKEIPSDKITKMKISAFLESMLHQLRDYVTKLSFWQVDTLPFILDVMYSDYVSRETINRKIWEPIIDKLNKWEVLHRAMKSLCEGQLLQDDAKMIWFNEISRAVVKRHLVDKLRIELSIKSSSTEEDEDQTGEKTLKKRLFLPIDCSKEDILMKLFARVEKKRCDLKKVTKLTSSVQYLIDSCSVMSMMKTLVLHPSKHTITQLKYLFEIVNPQFSDSKKEDLRDLLLIRLGQKSAATLPSLNNYKVMSVTDCQEIALKYKDTFDVVRIKEDGQEDKMEISDDETTTENFAEMYRSDFVRSGWNFNHCPLGITPWELEGSEYFHKPFDSENSKSSCVFPFSN